MTKEYFQDIPLLFHVTFDEINPKSLEVDFVDYAGILGKKSLEDKDQDQDQDKYKNQYQDK